MRRARGGPVQCSELAAIALGAVLALAACAPPPVALEEAPTASRNGDRIHPAALERRLGRVQPGQSLEEAHQLIGQPRVRRPGADGGTFPSPLRRVALETPEGRQVELELYVVSAAPAEGCPDVHAELAPLVALDGEVAALDWDYVERHWRGWGGELAALRQLRGLHDCPLPPAATPVAPAPPSP